MAHQEHKAVRAEDLLWAYLLEHPAGRANVRHQQGRWTVELRNPAAEPGQGSFFVATDQLRERAIEQALHGIGWLP